MKKVLVVSHDEELRLMLENLGYEVQVETESHKIPPIIQAFRYVFLDVSFPLPKLQHILSAAKEYRNHVILISESGNVETVSQLLEMGAEEYLSRPFNITMLKTRMHVFEVRRGALDLMTGLVPEIRNPLSNIKGYIDVLRAIKDGRFSNVEPSKEDEFLQIISSNAEWLEHIILSLRDMALVDYGELRLYDNSIVSIVYIVDEVLKEGFRQIKSIKDSIIKKDQHLEVSIPNKLPLINGDYIWRHVLAIILDNATRYTSEGGIIKISAFDLGEYLQVSISDSGVGINENSKHLVSYLEFFRDDIREVRELNGVGLGLYIARHLVEAYKGRLWFESEPGKGSTFHFTIPVAPQE